jgi:hypothetical protein
MSSNNLTSKKEEIAKKNEFLFCPWKPLKNRERESFGIDE